MIRCLETLLPARVPDGPYQGRLKAQTIYFKASGLRHAAPLLLRPQNVRQGPVAFQVAGGQLDPATLENLQEKA